MADTQKLKTSLTIQLLAGDTVVAETEDPHLWHQVLGVITASAQVSTISPPNASRRPVDSIQPSQEREAPAITPNPSDALGRWAQELGVDLVTLRGALDPTDEEPFIHVDTRTWEAFRKNYPTAGRKAIPPIVLAATAMAHWFSMLGLAPPTTAQAGSVLRKIHVRVANPGRSIKNCDWLQLRGESVVLNPAAISSATELLRNFCTKEPPR